MVPKEERMSHRKYIGLCINMVLESLHKRIKCNYLSSLIAKKLNKIIHALIRWSINNLFKRMIKFNRNKLSENLNRINNSHDNNLEIKMEHIILISSNFWTFLSRSKKDVIYEITKINEVCPPDLCSLKCNSCKIYIKIIYSCTCKGSKIRCNICKHIHAGRCPPI